MQEFNVKWIFILLYFISTIANYPSLKLILGAKLAWLIVVFTILLGFIILMYYEFEITIRIKRRDEKES
jgi:UPF0716 family protein affecting phage T7 exclusion